MGVQEWDEGVQTTEVEENTLITRSGKEIAFKEIHGKDYENYRIRKEGGKQRPVGRPVETQERKEQRKLFNVMKEKKLKEERKKEKMRKKKDLKEKLPPVPWLDIIYD